MRWIKRKGHKEKTQRAQRFGIRSESHYYVQASTRKSVADGLAAAGGGAAGGGLFGVHGDAEDAKGTARDPFDVRSVQIPLEDVARYADRLLLLYRKILEAARGYCSEIVISLDRSGDAASIHFGVVAKLLGQFTDEDDIRDAEMPAGL